jgi:hypothetical protein
MKLGHRPPAPWGYLQTLQPPQRVTIRCEICNTQNKVAEPKRVGDEVAIVCTCCETPLVATVLPL